MNLPKKKYVLKANLMGTMDFRIRNLEAINVLDSSAQKELADEMEAWLEPSKRRDQIIKFLRDEK